MTVEKLKEEKLALASAIMRLARDFDDRTGVAVNKIAVEKYDTSCMGGESYDYSIKIEVNI